MIELLLPILTIAEITVFTFAIVKINNLTNEISTVNRQIKEIKAEQITKDVKDSVTKASESISIFVETQKVKERVYSIKLIIHLIITAVTLLRNKKSKT